MEDFTLPSLAIQLFTLSLNGAIFLNFMPFISLQIGEMEIAFGWRKDALHVRLYNFLISLDLLCASLYLEMRSLLEEAANNGSC